MPIICASKVGAKHYRLMPAKGIFALGVGHTRRKSMEPGAKSAEPAEMHAVRAGEADANSNGAC